MEKQTRKAFNKKIYLLGVCKEDGKKVWLEEPSWDCGWYWGFGYLEKYTNNDNPERARDICEHSHFDKFFEKGGAYEVFIDYFEETTLRPDEIWLLLDYMQTFYTLRKTADLLHSGSSHYTSRAEMELLKDTDLYNHINQELLPALFKRIDKLLGGTESEAVKG